MKRILLISNRVMHYRVDVYNYFHEQFAKQGYQFIVRADELQKENPYITQFDFKAIPFTFALYKREIQAIQPDFVILFLHLKDPITFPLLYWLKWRRIPVIFWTKGANLDKPKDRISRLLYYHMHSLVDGIVLYSAKEMPFIKAKNRNKVTVANNTVNHRNYPQLHQSKEELKGELGIPFKKVALFTGRMDIGGGRKKVDHAIRIFNKINHPDYGLILVGSGLRPELREIINHKNTIYLGEVHDSDNLRISKIFKAADLFLMPGHVGLGINQAFFWGLPVLTEEGSHPPEIYYLVNGWNGYIVKENDIEALREKVVYLFENDQECQRLGDNAFKDIMLNASIENMFKGFMDNIRMRERDL